MIKQFSWMFAGRVVAAFLQFAGFALLINWVSPGEFGIIAALIGVSVVVVAFLDLGISTYILKAWPMVENRENVYSALRLNNLVTSAFLVAGTVSVSVVAVLWNAYFWSLLPLVVWAAAEKNADTWLCVAISNRMTHLNTVNLVGRRLIALAVMVALMGVWGNGAIAYTGGVALGALCSSVFAHVVIRPILSGNEGSGEYRSILRQARPYWIHSFATQVRNLDTVLVAFMASPVIAGYYGVASKLAGPLRMVPTSMAPVLVPEVVRHGISRRVLKAIGIVVLLMTTIYVGLSFTASLWVPYIFGFDYKLAVSAVQAMCIGLVFGATATLLGASLQAAGAQSMVARTSVIASAFCIPAIIAGTLLAGAAGAAVGMVSSFVVQTAVFLAYLWKMKRLEQKSQ